MNSDRPIRIVLAVGSDPLIDEVKRLLRNDTGLALVGQSHNFDQAIWMVDERKPDVLVLDLDMTAGLYGKAVGLRKVIDMCKCSVIAIATVADERSHQLSREIGTEHLMEKMSLAQQLIATIYRIAKRKSAAATAEAPFTA